MRAVKLTSPGTLELVETPIPEPGPGQVRVKVAGAGLCHSDLHVLHLKSPWPGPALTLGHEGSGWIDALGAGVTGVTEGDPVLVNLIWSCGHCRPCVMGRDNACVSGGRHNHPPTPGLGPDGAMAEYMLVPVRHALPLGDIDPVTAGPLADAALTPMRAINSVRDRLTPGSTAVVIGVGGLGHLAVQILHASTSARIIAVDMSDDKLDLARRHGADLAVDSRGDAAEQILAESDGYGVDAVFDFAGVQPTVDLATSIVAPEGVVRLVGLGGGGLRFGADADTRALPWGVDIRKSYGGTLADLTEVIALAAQQKLTVESTVYPLDDFQRAFDDLDAGRVTGRAILQP
ncbi:NAD(P)-dependent alcohol dehydrogenase [Gordonia phthalatica]|uniref:Dehydrogenase n=1 Tax=Gordonia phthalatica TaxID=1136941 RepID=A0A0N9NCT3_9ACTN|nr:NAD(P)-dependent alcohol dehydrogenase [Gordonia phthalatica]ALG85476.1 dehydrogenase [Gordonia phthalatica]